MVVVDEEMGGAVAVGDGEEGVEWFVGDTEGGEVGVVAEAGGIADKDDGIGWKLVSSGLIG